MPRGWDRGVGLLVRAAGGRHTSVGDYRCPRAAPLAQLYFPGAPRSSALRLLHKYITTAHGLLPALEQVGYTRASRRLTRRQVQLIFEFLGEP